MLSLEYTNLYDKLRTEGYHEGDEYKTHLNHYMPWIATNIKFNSCLDIGCSSGGGIYKLSCLNNKADYKGIDPSCIAIKKGQTLGRKLYVASATLIPFPDKSFDLVISSETFEHLHPGDIKRAVSETWRVCKGYIFIQVSTRIDVAKWKNIVGHPLHLTVKPIKWWIDIFCEPLKDFKILHSDNRSFCIKNNLF